MSITAYADELFRLLSMTMYLWISRSAIQILNDDFDLSGKYFHNIDQLYKYDRTKTEVKVAFSSLINDQRDTHLILK